MEKILVIDLGSQYTQLIARRLRELSVYSEVCPWDEIPDLSAVKGFILSGGPESSNIEGNPSIHQQIFDSKKPILGICYGMQVLAHQEEGRIINEGKREFGYAKIDKKQDSVLFKNLDKSKPSNLIKFNVANEFAVNMFKDKLIKYTDIYRIVKKIVSFKLYSRLNNIKDIIKYHEALEKKIRENFNYL